MASNITVGGHLIHRDPAAHDVLSVWRGPGGVHMTVSKYPVDQSTPSHHPCVLTEEAWEALRQLSYDDLPIAGKRDPGRPAPVRKLRTRSDLPDLSGAKKLDVQPTPTTAPRKKRRIK